MRRVIRAHEPVYTPIAREKFTMRDVRNIAPNAAVIKGPQNRRFGGQILVRCPQKCRFGGKVVVFVVFRADIGAFYVSSVSRMYASYARLCYYC